MALPILALIAGSGVEERIPEGASRLTADTPYGPVEGLLVEGGGRPFVVLRRHGPGHALPPHRIPYRALIWALWWWGCREVVATAAVGALRGGLSPGDLLVVDDFLDFTRGRAGTFFDHTPKVHHVDLTHPYCPRLSRGLRQLLGEPPGGRPLVYACTEGPRFETPAEIRALERLGADVVGQTQVPEVALAREAGLCYAAVALVTNAAAGRTGEAVSETVIYARLEDAGDRFWKMFTEFLADHGEGAGGCETCGGPGLGDRPGG